MEEADMENTSIDRLCESFLQTINQYNALEKKTHTYDIDPQIYLSEIHTIVADNFFSAASQIAIG